MLLEDFLRQEEKRLSGQAVKVPVNIDLRNKKAELIYELFGKYWRYRRVFLEGGGGEEKFSQRIHKTKNLSINIDDLIEFYKGFVVDNYERTLRQFLHSNYEPPKWEEPVGLYDGSTTVWMPTFLDHTIVCLFYQVSAVYAGYVYPMVDDFVNFAETRLIVESLTKATGIAKTAARSDGGSKEKKNKPVLEAVMQYLRDNTKALSGKTNEQIARKFCKKYKDTSPMEINIDATTWEVFYELDIDAEKITSRIVERYGKKKAYKDEKSIAYSTFRQKYIPKAKK